MMIEGLEGFWGSWTRSACGYNGIYAGERGMGTASSESRRGRTQQKRQGSRYSGSEVTFVTRGRWVEPRGWWRARRAFSF
jgi:hypothetical protein